MLAKGTWFSRKKLGLLVLIGCLVFASATYAASSSTPYATISWGNGKYYISNNTWGSANAGSGWWESIYYNSDTDLGWTWDWKDTDPYSVKGYPSIVSGWHWTQGYTTNSGFPTRIWDNKNINTSVSYSLSATGTYNAAYDIWVHDTDAATYNTRPTDEIMIWLNNTNAGPIGSYVETVTIGGASWNLYKGWLSDSSTTGWNVFSYVRTSNTSSATLNIRDFTNHLVYTKYWMSNSKFISSVEFGSEIFIGSGNLNISNYSVNVQ
ncbi:glycoside hydrolase [Paenibacillus sp. HN-1]|uniref:GH12 family glycosyl hydrolase domain-containing protein n=1 Tax=Paenibacillus TaxID=44249 RepID=UPI001CA9C32F|nr:MULTISPECIES: glycoside hydrolase [Paenibacillus]MBY9077117.1 glycoside hydrolase [Paenibacillus sp. CGMCC 1.18879]MBY9084698.1 glycoside hydrolase [Paenibacillus sinensis]